MRIDRVMGTVVTIDVRHPGFDAAAVDAAFAFLRGVDARFSPYRPDSEVGRLIRGQVDADGCSDDLRHLLALCEDLRRTSGGVFDIRGHRRDGRPDPTGIVKGWAVEEAARILDEAGARAFVVSAGGDIVARGEPEPGIPWRIGVRHPKDADRMAAVLAVRDLSVATSGAYERGGHITDPRTGRPAQGLISVTVVGPSLTLGDAYATAAFAMGVPGVAWAAGRTGCDALGITGDRRLLTSAGIDRLLAG
ncbi:MAG: FAD:protein FMN transferase [Chloroflexi bacterium]|jgi:thiamine biosynthesis lipoprotein|nr:FAD:protein FMN transferase [Chloroflexota bacterium]